ncbi:MAG: dihydroorotate dehydrogenase electron transfer subunit [Dethiosulfovibrio peptidovorans]|nr:MAG: dihydroorotate dehydrogenase electron transfer subunit [Dethiosulfovibrio peptidovorans]
MCKSVVPGKVETAEVLGNKSLAPGIFDLVIQAPAIAGAARPGQFLNLYCHSPKRMLPRPISICEADSRKGTLSLVYAVTGEGTREFSRLKAGGSLRVMGPLGNGFSVHSGLKKSILAGGGVGTPPMVELAKNLPGEKIIILGFRSTHYLADRLSRYGEVHIATDDGSSGFHGNVVELMDSLKVEGEQLFACGPRPMLKALQKWSAEQAVPAQLSLEERMGCGIGTCVGCVVKIKTNNEQGWHYRKICTDGPVFPAEEVIFE